MSNLYRIEAGYILPHPPIIVPGVSNGPLLAGQTVAGLEKIAGQFKRIQPETVVVISPHAPMFRDFLFLYDSDELSGNLGRFGAPSAGVSHPLDRDFQQQLIDRIVQAGYSGGSLSPGQMRQHQIEQSLDHGAVVPLWFLDQMYPDYKLVVMSSSGLGLEVVYRIGELIRQTAAALSRRLVVIASGDQSHRVNSESPYGVVPEGAKYDSELVEKLTDGDTAGVLTIDDQVRERAGECGYRSIVMLLGAMNRQAVCSRVESYEAPYGIGYCVASIKPDPDRTEPIADAYEQSRTMQRDRIEKDRSNSSVPVRIARETLEAHVQGERGKGAAAFKALAGSEQLFSNQAGAFVSIKKHGELRGCIGTTGPTAPSLVEEIMRNAVSAGTRDPRFPPVTADELPELTYSVDILGQPEPVQDPSDLDVRRFGVIVSAKGRSGLLLPDLEGVDTVEDQLAIACRKAGISPDEAYRIQRFEVIRYQ